MRKIIYWCSLPLCLLLFASSSHIPQDGWVSLFDGKSLTSWKVGENANTFSVENGTIVAHGPTAHLFYEGDVHEHAVVEGETGQLDQSLVHLTHRNFISGLRKSADWTPMEARLLFEANHPKMTTLRLLKVMIDEFLYRYIWSKGYKDGIEGGIEAITQSVNRFFVYEQLWELQRKPSLEKTYQQIEQEVVKLWEKEKK
jgi:hypothetical protein